MTSNRTIQKINSINNLLSETIEIVQNKKPKIYRKELIELLFEQPYSKIEYVVKKMNVERKSASRYLKSIEQIGIINSEKIGRENIYVNRKLIEILKSTKPNNVLKT